MTQTTEQRLHALNYWWRKAQRYEKALRQIEREDKGRWSGIAAEALAEPECPAVAGEEGAG